MVRYLPETNRYKTIDTFPNDGFVNSGGDGCEVVGDDRLHRRAG